MLLLALLISISPAKASFTSLLVPGTGDLLMGEKKRGVAFLSLEVATWVSYFGFKWYEGEVNNSSLNFAKLHASANVDGNDDRYLIALENYLSSEQYNEIIREEARALYPDTTDPDILERRREYIQTYSYTGDDAWEWDSKASASRYDELRDSKRDFAQKARNMVGFAIANRIVNFFVTYVAGDNVSVKFDEKSVEVGVSF